LFPRGAPGRDKKSSEKEDFISIEAMSPIYDIENLAHRGSPAGRDVFEYVTSPAGVHLNRTCRIFHFPMRNEPQKKREVKKPPADQVWWLIGKSGQGIF
jgi:hypothetical protein